MTQVFERKTDAQDRVDLMGEPMTVAERQRAIALIERVRACELPSGAVDPARVEEATAALREAVELLRPFTPVYASLGNCIQDMDEWLAAGLTSPPNMRHLVKHGLAIIPEGVEDAMLTVTTTLNYSEHPTLEFVVFKRFEGPPAAALREMYVCKYLCIAQMVEATSGFGMESNCIVCFTECLAGGGDSPDVMDVFFTSKNALRGKVILQPLMEHIFADGIFEELRGATLDELRLIVPCKTVTHEWSHRQGVIPLTEYRVLFDNFIGAGLEEARVELNGAHILYKHAEQGGPHARIYNMAAQFIIADRLLRYPYSALPWENADAVSGQYFLGQMIDKGMLTCNAGGVFLAGRATMIEGLGKILKEIEETQYKALVSSIPEAHKAFRDHVAVYSRGLRDDNTMDRTLFFHWMEHKLGTIIPTKMDWKSAIAEHGE